MYVVKFRSFYLKRTLAKKNLSYFTLISANAEEYIPGMQKNASL
jgi:hypothetical protein